VWNVGGCLGSAPTVETKILPRRQGLGTRDRTGGQCTYETMGAAPQTPPVHPPPPCVLVAFTGGRDHHGSVRTKGFWRPPALPLCLLASLAGMAGCSYDYPDAAHTPGTEADGVATALPTKSAAPPADPLVLEREVRNYQDLDGLLKAVPGDVLLFQEGPLDGPARGFGTTEQVDAAGEYTVTAACIGAPNAKIFIRQENPTVTLWPVELTVNCPGPASQVITLQQGYVSAHLSLPAPADTPWTGAVGGVRVTG
jgi:hypothetical protein